MIGGSNFPKIFVEISATHTPLKKYPQILFTGLTPLNDPKTPQGEGGYGRGPPHTGEREGV